MESVDGQLIFSATDLINHLECPHLTQLDIEVALGRVDLTETRSDTTELVARKGDEHRSEDHTSVFRSDLINPLECPHLTQLDIEVALGRVDLTETRSDTTELVARKGDEH